MNRKKLCFCIAQLVACGTVNSGSDDDEMETGEPINRDFFEEVSLEENAENVLLWSASAMTNEAVKVRVEFSAEGVPNRETNTGLMGTAHAFNLVGLRSETEYLATFTAFNDDNDMLGTSEAVFVTGTLPDGIEHFSVKESKLDEMQPGYTVLGPSVNGIYGVAVDNAGEVVWYYRDDNTREQNSARKLEELDDGNLLILTGRGFRVVDALGATLTEYSGGGSRPVIHHDVVALPNGHYLALSNETKTVDVPELGGDTLVLGDVVVEVDTVGDIVWSWSTFDHLDTSRFPSEMSLKESKGEAGRDWTHANSLDYLASDNSFLISLRSQHWVIKVSRDTGELIWRFGAGGDFELAQGDWFYGQHHVKWTSKGLTLYDNGNERPEADGGYSRGVRYVVDELDMTASEAQSYSSSLYTTRFGSTQLQANGNLLMCVGGVSQQEHAQIVEVDPAGDPVWTLELDTVGLGVYRAYRLSETWPYDED